ncbi:MAG TPA: SHOCT domain-containing protein [Acidimicrobiales bacterium]|jgi:ABC-type multidrug transport system fused ATPase/permease subunit|nr:SHOCT domain-containing protein [Acidimicrobiales bacterium]
MIGTQYPLLDIFWTMLEFFLFFIWIFLIITIFMDIFRSHDMKGVSKFLWVLFIIILPLIGALVYLIARGGSMHERSAQQAKAQEQAFQTYVRHAAGGASAADELAKLTDLKSKGAISDEEFEKAKTKILG